MKLIKFLRFEGGNSIVKCRLSMYFIIRPLNTTFSQTFFDITWQRNFGLENAISSPAESYGLLKIDGVSYLVANFM